MSVRRRIDEARLAGMLLTRLPMGRMHDPVPSLAEAAWAYPLAGLPLGVIGWAVFSAALWLDVPGVAAALLSIAATALATGALHHDGLADLADGLGGGQTAERALEIMRDSRIGSYGTLALILAVGVQAGAMSGVVEVASLPLFLLIAVGSRLAMLAALIGLPAIRDEGLGRSAAGGRWVSLMPGAALVAVGVFLVGAVAWSVLLCGAVAAGLTAWQARRRIGGQTGDVLGAVQRISCVAGWLGAAIAIGT